MRTLILTLLFLFVFFIEASFAGGSAIIPGFSPTTTSDVYEYQQLYIKNISGLTVDVKINVYLENGTKVSLPYDYLTVQSYKPSKNGGVEASTQNGEITLEPGEMHLVTFTVNSDFGYRRLYLNGEIEWTAKSNNEIVSTVSEALVVSGFNAYDPTNEGGLYGSFCRTSFLVNGGTPF